MNEAHHLGSLVHNWAVASKVDAAQPALQRGAVDLCALVERVAARHRSIAAGRGIGLECATPERLLHAQADVTELEQATAVVSASSNTSRAM